jgi:myo-inositol catabolism protein IolC
MRPGADPLYFLAIDHRTSFTRLLGRGGTTPDDLEVLRDAKDLVYEGFSNAIDRGAPRGASGILVDEELGANVARSARRDGHPFAMPVERSGQALFELEYGDLFAEHVDRFDPDYVKVLVRWNPGDPEDARESQGGRLRELGGWIATTGRQLLFELLVPPTEDDLAQVDGDRGRYDRELRPTLTIEAMRQVRDTGITPSVWKIEGFERRDHCERLGRALAVDGRSSAESAIVLGRGADLDAVDRWLRAAAPVAGYRGFAIGRSIWADAVTSFVAGDASREQARDQIATRFLRFVNVYRAATDDAGTGPR